MSSFQALIPGNIGRQPESLSNDLRFYWAEAGNSIDYVPPTTDASASFLTAFQAGADFESAKLLACINLGGVSNGSILSSWTGNNGTLFGVALLSPVGVEWLAANGTKTCGLIRFETSLLLRDPRPRRKPTQTDLNEVMPSVSGQSTSSVLLGMVDYGCPFAHIGLRLKDKKTTRILSLWDQGKNSAGQTLGQEFSRATLSGFMTAATSSGYVDEAACYRQNDFDALAARTSHGAHMLGLLAGAAASPSLCDGEDLTTFLSRPWEDTATDSDIVFVQLPPEYLQAMPRTGLTPYQLMGMKYILDSAGPRTSQVVIPVSSETFEGPHDGSSLLESAIDALVEYANREKGKTLDIVFASGNAADLAICLKLPDSAPTAPAPNLHTTSFTVRVLPNNEIPTFVEVWLPSEAPESDVFVEPPNQAATNGVGQGAWVWPSANQPECVVIHPEAIQAGGQGKCILVRIAPTFSAMSGGAVASFGDWCITLSSASPISGAWAYVARSYHGMGGKRRSYQSYFPEHPRRKDWEFLRKLPLVRMGLGSINGLACGSNVTVVSGYVLRPRKQTGDGASAAYAGRGPARGGRLKNSILVDSAAPTDESRCLTGIKSWGNVSGASVRMNGTSVAAPIAARELTQFAWLWGSATSDSNCEPQLKPRGRLGR